MKSSAHHTLARWLLGLLAIAALTGGLPVFAALTANYKLNETSGTTINAQVGPSGSLTGSGNAWIAGQLGNALSLDGNGNGYVEDDAVLDGANTNNNITVSFWVFNPSSASQPGATILQKGMTNQITYSFRLDATGGGIDYSRDRAQAGYYVRNSGSLAYDTWHHVVGVYSRNQAATNDITANNNMQLFIDGKSAGTRSSSGNLTNSTGRFTIGAQDAGGGNFNMRFQGNVDDIGVWNECLTFKKIAALYALGIFEGLDLSSPQIDQFVNAFANQGSITIGADNWHYATGLGSTTIGTTGGTAGNDAYVVMDGNGNGMKIAPGAAPTLTTVASLAGATEDTPFTITYAALAAAADEADPDSPSLSFMASTIYGTLTMSGTNVVPNVTLLSPGESWVWTPKTNACGLGVTSFLVRAFDGVYQSFPVPVPVNVTCVNDSPSLQYLNFYESATFNSETSASAQGWTGYNNNVLNVFGWSNTSYAGGAPGEAGGTFQRVPVDAAGWYADTDLGGTLGLDDALSASGRLVVTNNISANGNWYLGHFNVNGFSGLSTNFVGLQFAESSATAIRMFAYVRLQDGTARVSSASTVTFNSIAYFDYNYDPNGNGGLGQLVVTLRDSGSNSLATQTLNLLAGDKDIGAQLGAWGASEAALTLGVNYIDMFWDNVTYTRAPQTAPSPVALNYTALYPPLAIAPTTMTLRDGDNSLSSALVQITGNYQNGQDLLVYTQIGNIAGSWNSANGTLTLSGSDTVANYQAALWSVKYRNTSSTPSLVTRTVSFKANDGVMDTATLTRDISVSAPPAGFNVLSLTSVSSAGTAVFGFMGAPAYRYALDWSTNLALPNWSPVVTNLIPAGGLTSYTNTSAARENFYRTRLVP
jgi:hypothetical protein